MKVKDIEPRFEDIEGRLTALEADQHTHAGGHPDNSVPTRNPQRNSTAGEAAEEASTFPPAKKADAHAGLKADIQADIKVYDANTVAQAMLHEVIAPKNNRNQSRESVMSMETGETLKVQPFRLTDATYKVVSREMLDRIMAETAVDAIEWQAEDYDCEDIARKFVTKCCDLGINSVGRVMAWSGQHAFCVAVVQDGPSVDFVFIEPQTDEIITEFTGNYDISNALIIIA